MKLTNFSSVVDTYKDNFLIRKKRFFDEKEQIREKKRKEREENIETVKAVEPLIKTSTAKKTKPKNFLDGIYEFLGFALAGLVLSNLDSIISIASEIYEKIKELKEGIDNFVTSIQDTVDSFYSGFESFKQGSEDLLSPILNADLSNIIPFQNELEKVLTATLNVVDKIFGESEESSTPPLGRNLNPSKPNRPGSGVKPPKPTSPKPKSTSPFKLEQARKKTTTTKLYRGSNLGKFKAPHIPRSSAVKPPPLLSSVSTTPSSSAIKPGINSAQLIKNMRSGIVNPGNLKYLNNLGKGFIVGSVLDYAAMSALNKGYELVGMDNKSIVQRIVKRYMEMSDDDKKEYLRKINNGLKREIDYQKSPTFIVEKIIAMGGEVISDRKIKMMASILATIAALSGDSVLSSDINVNDLPEALRTVYEQSSSRQPSAITSGGGSDFWTLVAVAATEDNDGQARADVAQSIYNRKASGAYEGGTIRELILADGQYQPTWDYPRKNPKGDKANSEWYNIVDAETAAAATGKSVNFIQQAAADIQNTRYQKEAKKFVGARTDFTNYSKPNRREEVVRTTNTPNNYFGFDWNYRGNKMGSMPNFTTTLTPTLSPSSSLPPSSSLSTSILTPQTKTYAILCYGTNDFSLSESQIKTNATGMIRELKSKGYNVVVVPPSSQLYISRTKQSYKAPYRGVFSAASEEGVTIELGVYAPTDQLGKYVHLEPSNAKTIRNKYKPAIYVGDSNAVRIAGKHKEAKAKIKGKTTTTAVTGYGGNKIQELIDNISTSPSKSPNILATGLTATLENMISQNSHNSNGKVTTLLDAENLVAKDSSKGLNQDTRYSMNGMPTREIVNNIFIPLVTTA
jgi:hypothetical protein